MERTSFASFKQLSLKTGLQHELNSQQAAQTGGTLADPNGEWPSRKKELQHAASQQQPASDDKLLCRSGKARALDQNGTAKAIARTGLIRSPRKYKKIILNRENENRPFQFLFKGCNCRKKDSSGSRNLLICRNLLLGPYKNIGVCINDWIESKRGGYTAVDIK